MARRKWILRNADKSLAKELAYECGINQLSALILCGRGFVDPVDIFEFYDEVKGFGFNKIIRFTKK